MRPTPASVTFLNPRTCGVYKDGGTRYVVDRATGQRTKDVDDELNAQVDAYLAGREPDGAINVPVEGVRKNRILVPTYYDPRYGQDIRAFLVEQQLRGTCLGELVDRGVLEVSGGHGSPSNDQRVGSVPYIKVSDLRALRVNVNPTNLIPEALAKSLWGGGGSGLEAWDLISPNRASSNIGEFCVLLPGEERVVLTKEVFVFRVKPNAGGWDPFYLLWALCLKPVRRQWTRVALMQTNREDVGERYREVILPEPRGAAWMSEVARPFREYFTAVAKAREQFRGVMSGGGMPFPFIASVAEMARGEFEEREIVPEDVKP